VELYLLSLYSDTTAEAASSILCAAPASAGQFTVPASVMLGLIPTQPGESAGNNYVVLVGYSTQAISIPGIDYALGLWTGETQIETTFK
jgi:hypothetical protein